jgi:hypothetical protein
MLSLEMAYDECNSQADTEDVMISWMRKALAQNSRFDAADSELRPAHRQMNCDAVQEAMGPNQG